MAALQAELELEGDFTIQCALLHDVIEDSQVTFEEIKAKFGKKVAQGVLALSKNRQLPKSQQMKDSLDRIQKQPREVWIVKMVDRITNLQPPPQEWTRKQIKDYRIEALGIYEALKTDSAYMADRLLNKIKAY
jgi:(p)ppGpp synthase/HD superfamily hydrolase